MQASVVSPMTEPKYSSGLVQAGSLFEEEYSLEFWQVPSPAQ